MTDPIRGPAGRKSFRILSNLEKDDEKCSIFNVKNSIGRAQARTLETGRVARQADGAVLATWGETTVLATVVAAKAPKPGLDFFPLTVHYQEKAFAAGRIPGGYPQARGTPVRQGDADLAPDRPADPPAVPRRLPLRHAGHRHRPQPRSRDRSRHSGDGRRLGGADPFGRSVHGSDRRRRGSASSRARSRLNPTIEEMKDSTLDLVVAGTADAVLMVESEAKELSEEMMLQAVMAGHAASSRSSRRSSASPRRRPRSRANSSLADKCGGREGGARGRRSRSARRLFDHPEAGALRRRRRGQGQGDGGAGCPRAVTPSSPPKRSPRRSTTPRPRWCAGTSSTTSAASTAAT